MAKAQTFGDKAKKKQMGDQRPNVKFIKWYHDDQRGALRCLERFVRVDDLSQVDKIDVKK